MKKNVRTPYGKRKIKWGSDGKIRSNKPARTGTIIALAGILLCVIVIHMFIIKLPFLP